MNKLIGRTQSYGDAYIAEDTQQGTTVAIVKDATYLNVMAAAPELLQALKALLQSGESTNAAFYVKGTKRALLAAFEGQKELLRNASEAVSKAEGGE